MTKKKKVNTDNLSEGWKALAPKSSRRPATKAAYRKRIFGISKILALVLVLALMGSGVWFLQNRIQKDSGPFDLTGPGVPIANLTFRSNGVLHRQWFENWFGPLRGRSLMEIDIDQVQSELINEPQISFARVTRKFPDTLLIELKERKPILKICLRSKKDGEQTWLVSNDGTLYLGVGYSTASMRHLPFLKLNPKLLTPLANGKGYEKLEGVPAVAPLLELARNEYPGFYQNWQVVSYQRPNDEDPGAHIHIKSGKVRSLRFAPDHFNSQLRRLNYLLHEPDFRRKKVIDSIDLSHQRSVFAK